MPSHSGLPVKSPTGSISPPFGGLFGGVRSSGSPESLAIALSGVGKPTNYQRFNKYLTLSLNML